MGECTTNNNACDTSKPASCDAGAKPASGECTLAEDLICAAKQAKCELMREKMKKVIDAKIGKKMDKMAEAAVDAMIACMQHQMAGKEACNSYKEKLFAALKS